MCRASQRCSRPATLVGVTGRNADVDVVAGVGELNLTCRASVTALEVGAIMLRRGRGDAGRTKQHESRDGHGQLEHAHVASPSSKSRYWCGGREIKIGHRAVGTDGGLPSR